MHYRQAAQGTDRNRAKIKKTIKEEIKKEVQKEIQHIQYKVNAKDDFEK